MPEIRQTERCDRCGKSAENPPQQAGSGDCFGKKSGGPVVICQDCLAIHDRQEFWHGVKWFSQDGDVLFNPDGQEGCG